MEYAQTKQSDIRKKAAGGFDYSLLLITFCLIGFGLLMIYSSSAYTAQAKYGDSAFFLKKQSISVLIGAVVMLLASRFHYKLYIKRMPFIRIRLVTLLLIFAFIFQIIVLTPLFGSVNGAKRWILIGPVSFQPAEYTKFVVIIFTAYMIQRGVNAMNKLRGIVRIFIPVGILIALVAKENLSSAATIFLIVFAMCAVSARKRRWYVALFLMGVGAALAYVHFGDSFRSERIAIWRDPESHPGGEQIVQGLYAIASGGIFGSGLGEGMQKLGKIPEPQNDMIFSIICEELGLVGAGIVILMYILLCWRIFTAAMNAPDLFSSLICTGVMIHMGAQAVLNIAVVTNTLPSTGISLPFISYGGTSVAFLMAEIGVVLGITAVSGIERRRR